MKYTKTEATNAINAISDRHAYNRYTVLEAIKQDDQIGYLIECFLNDEPDLDTGRKVTKQYFMRKLKEFNRMVSFKVSEATFRGKPACKAGYRPRTSLLRERTRRSTLVRRRGISL
jgi:hypothetical protein